MPSKRPSPPATPEVDRPSELLYLDKSRARADRALFERYLDERDPVDRAVLVERFLPLARQLASRYQRAAEPFDDLFQVAWAWSRPSIASTSSVRSRSPATRCRRSSASSKRYFRDRTWSVRVPRDLRELSLQVDRAIADLTLMLQRAPTVAEIAASIAAQEAEVLEALHAAGAYRAVSLEAPRGNSDEDSDDSFGTR